MTTKVIIPTSRKPASKVQAYDHGYLFRGLSEKYQSIY